MIVYVIFLSHWVIVLFFSLCLTVLELDSFCVETATTTRCKFQWYYLNDSCTCNLIIEHVNDIPAIFVIINWACLERNCIEGYSLTCHIRCHSLWSSKLQCCLISNKRPAICVWCHTITLVCSGWGQYTVVVMWHCIKWTWNKPKTELVSHCANSQHWGTTLNFKNFWLLVFISITLIDNRKGFHICFCANQCCGIIFWSLLSLFSIWLAVFVWYHDWCFMMCYSCIYDHFLSGIT